MLGVLYAEDFDEDGESMSHAVEHPAPEPEIIEPSFTSAELEAARQDWLFNTEISPPIGAGTRILTISSLESRHAAKR